MQYAVSHRTVYDYESDVSVSHHVAHLHPRELPGQRVAGFELQVEPVPAVMAGRVDFYGNTATVFSIDAPHDALSVTARSRVSVTPPRLPPAALTPPWEQVRKRCSSDVLGPDSAAGEYRFDSPLIVRKAAFADYAAASFPKDRPLLEGVADFTARIFHDFKFDPEATSVATPL